MLNKFEGKVLVYVDRKVERSKKHVYRHFFLRRKEIIDAALYVLEVQHDYLREKDGKVKVTDRGALEAANICTIFWDGIRDVIIGFVFGFLSSTLSVIVGKWLI